MTRASRSSIALLLGVACLLLTAPATATAAPPAPEDFSAADQYVETLPDQPGLEAGPQIERNQRPAVEPDPGTASRTG